MRPFVAGPLCFRSDLARIGQEATVFGVSENDTRRGETEKRRERKLSGVAWEHGVSMYAHSSYSPTSRTKNDIQKDLQMTDHCPLRLE